MRYMIVSWRNPKDSHVCAFCHTDLGNECVRAIVEL